MFFVARVILLCLVLVSAGCGSRVLRVSDRLSLPVKAMVEEAKGSRIIFVGEVHTDEDHHDLQLEVLREVHGAGDEVAVALEMFTTLSQSHLNAWSEGTMAEEAFAELYRRDWRNTPYELYAGIFRYARDNRIRLVGLNVPRDIVQKVAKSGFASLSEEEMARLPAGVTCDVTPEFRRDMMQVFSSHHGGARSVENFCEAQMLRNSVMASVLVDFLEKNPSSRVVVIVGGGHALKQGGIPDLLPSALQSQVSVILPAISGITADNVTTDQTDYLLLDSSSSLLDLLMGL
jgi:uncharacterized iron-regulated protein